MPLPPGCPTWDYATHPDSAAVVPRQTAILLARLRRGDLDGGAAAQDTRPVHHHLFSQLTPPACDYYAGHYRGEPFHCLAPYEVRVPSDPRVGYPPANVMTAMDDLRRDIEAHLAALDMAREIPDVQVSPADKLLYAVAAACRVFVKFLTIHPYANGNGHVARFCVWAILGRYGAWPVRWPVEPRPPDPPYADLIARYRGGDHEPLERVMLGCCR